MNRAGRLAASLIVALQLAYAVVLIAGLAALPSEDAPIPDPYFTVMELLILFIAPLLVILMAAVHEAVPPARKLFSLCALVFMAMCATVTSLVHFLILTVSRDLPGDWSSVFAFRWPSVAYAADILAWDIFFALSVLSASRIFRSAGLSLWTGRLLLGGGVLSLLGLLGVVIGDMQVRNIGILGYAVVFPVVVLMMRKVLSQQTF